MSFPNNSSGVSKNLYIFALIFFAFIFSSFVRLTWVYQMNTPDNDIMRWNGEFMVTTNDSYYWAEGARDLIYCDRDNASMGEYYQQNCHQEFDLSPINEPLPQLTNILYKILPFSLETIIFYLPVFGASLVVIPIILIGRGFNLTLTGFIAALIASISISYYSRSVVGYYDTDMLNILFPMLLVWSISLALKTKEKKYLLLSGLEIVIYRWWYPQSYSLEFAFFGLVVIYTIYMLAVESSSVQNKKLKLSEIIFLKQNVSNYYLLSIMLIGMMGAPFVARFIGVIVLYLITFKKDFEKFAPYILAVSIVAFFITGGINPILNQLNSYIFQREGTIADGELHFFSVTQTIVEAQATATITDVANRIIGGELLFAIAIAGYGLLCFRQPAMLLMLPLLGLGIMSFKGGLRFAMYATPVAAFGIGFFIFRCAELLQIYIKNKIAAFAPAAIFVFIATIYILNPLVKNGWNYRTGTVFTQDEVKLIEDFGKKVNSEDYVITWWDYGYPIRYYADVKTLVDGAKHSGDVNFAPSFILSHDQKSAANLARLDVEYTENRSLIEKINLNRSEKDKIQLPSNNIAWIMKDYGFKDSNNFIASLKKDINLPKKTRDIYFYLPFRMIDIYPTIMRFSYLDLMSGKSIRQPFFLVSKGAKDAGNILNLEQGFFIDKQQALLVAPNKQAYPLRRFVQAGYQQEGFKTNINELRYDGIYTLINLQTYNVFLVVDEAMYNSVYVQLFYLEQYDHELFELIAANPYGKFFKLKL
ncbi:MAG: peptide transporter [Campylobacteraceae bacterium]|jgi:dolichyl-diphosphooligosaccharide--protein glycosyltransferase/undecaprenyl-diphosphooligosaccharide--protein glycosyltransferase|nr:peptide transporter [Campylobacteraceae bacterium]